MISAQETAQGIYGALRLARFERAAIALFELGEQGFWRSFWAAAIVAPPYALLIALRMSEATFSSDPVRTVLIEAIAFAIGWVAFPLVMVYAADALGSGARYFRYVTAYNWCIVVQITVFAAVAVLGQGLLPTPLAGALSLAVTMLMLIYQWFVARIGLEIGALAAAGIVILDVLIGLVVSGVAQRLA